MLNTEGGFVNDPIDKGGATNRGISWNVWVENAQTILGISPTLENLEKLTSEDAMKIYKHKFWDSIKLDEINDGDIRWLIFDFYVNSGSNAIYVLQKVLNNAGSNLTVDGKLGNQTINAINNSENIISLYNNFKQGRINFIQAVINKDVNRYIKKFPNATQTEIKNNTQKKFENGWMNRIKSFIDKTIDNFENVNC